MLFTQCTNTNRMIAGGLVITALCFLYGGRSEAEPLLPCSSPDAAEIMVQEGFDCEVFVAGLFQPTALAVEANGNVLVTETGFTTGQNPVKRFSPAGELLATSDPFADPDGVTVDTTGRILVTDSPQITIVNSLDGGIDEVCQPVPGNLQDVDVDSQGRIVVMDFNGNIYDVVCGESTTLCVTLGSIGVGVAFDESDRLFATRFAAGAGLFRIDQCTPADTVKVANLSGARRIAFGPGGRFGEEIYVTDENVTNAGRLVTIDEVSGTETEFATGFMIPNGLAFDGQNSLYVTDLRRGRVIKIFAEELPVADFRCNEAEGADIDIVVSLEDQFEAMEALVDEPTRFCSPVDKDGGGIPDPSAHLACYEIEVSGNDDDDDDDDSASVLREVTIENQFGEQVLTTGRSKSLCVPSRKNEEPSDLVLDHFKCYEAKGDGLNATVDLSDGSSTARGVIVKRPKRFCNPVDKNGEGILDSSSHLTCYRIRVPGPEYDDELAVLASNQFGEQVLEVGDPKLLCIPSEKLGFEVIESPNDDDDDD
ncbi:MAG: hypothetical protein QNJ30_19195 [Kiloniellales bacterium]|nr:hypothetical protein [Kiloniellales bacterium]